MDMNEFENFEQPVIDKKIQDKAKNALLGAALLWFGYSLLIAFVTAILTLVYIEPISQFFDKHLYGWLAIGLVTLAITCVCLWVGNKMPFWALLIFVTLSMIGIGFSVLSLGLYEALHTFNWKGMFLVLLIPAGAIILFGLLARFNLINMSIVWVTILICLGIMFVVFIVSFFVMNYWLYALYITLGLVVTFLYMAVDWYLIMRFNKEMAYYVDNSEKEKAVIKIGLYFGVRLALDYIYAFLYLIKLFELGKK